MATSKIQTNNYVPGTPQAKSSDFTASTDGYLYYYYNYSDASGHFLAEVYLNNVRYAVLGGTKTSVGNNSTAGSIFVYKGSEVKFYDVTGSNNIFFVPKA